jgi:hypothetical protein
MEKDITEGVHRPVRGKINSHKGMDKIFTENKKRWSEDYSLPSAT